MIFVVLFWELKYVGLVFWEDEEVCCGGVGGIWVEIFRGNLDVWV